MKTQIATDREQSKRLLACGVKPETADMSIDVDTDKYYLIPFSERVDKKHEIPAWSLSALLDLLSQHLDNFPFTHWRPPFLEDEIWEKDTPSELNGEVKLYFSDDRWIVDYDWDGFQGTMPQGKHPIEAVVQAIELLHANGYSLNNI